MCFIVPYTAIFDRRLNMTFRLRFVLLVVVLLIVVVRAQDDIPPLIPDESQIVTLEGNIDPTLLRFDGVRGQTVILTARDVPEGESLDVVLEVLQPNGARLRFNDNHMGGDSSLAQTDSRIKVILPQDGEYVVRVNSYGGIFEGDVEVLLQVVDLFSVEIIEDNDGLTMLTLTLPSNLAYQHELTLEAGDVLTITARDIGGSLDPVVRLVDSDGVVIAQNDDHGTAATHLDVFDAQIADFIVETTGEHVIEVLDFLGRGGQIELTIVRN
jgi:hypothetical protein